MEQNKEQTGEIVMYQPDETIRLEVRMDNETDTHIGQQFQLDIKRHNEQYAPVKVVKMM